MVAAVVVVGCPLLSYQNGLMEDHRRQQTRQGRFWGPRTTQRHRDIRIHNMKGVWNPPEKDPYTQKVVSLRAVLGPQLLCGQKFVSLRCPRLAARQPPEIGRCEIWGLGLGLGYRDQDFGEGEV